jgi:hypothetical protein
MRRICRATRVERSDKPPEWRDDSADFPVILGEQCEVASKASQGAATFLSPIEA